MGEAAVFRKDIDMKLKDKVAVITGAASGIGKASALLFAAEGAKVVVCDIDEQGAHETADLVAMAGGKAISVRADVSKASDSRDMIAAAEEHFGAVNVVFNNAGIMHGRDDNAVTTEEDVWDMTMAVNLKGVFLGCKYGIPALKRAGGGSVINTASFVAILGAATPQIAYTASKGGVLAMTRELAVVHARENIRVNALLPGLTDTKFASVLIHTEEIYNMAISQIPMKRHAAPIEMAGAVLYLVSDAASFTTGTCIACDGGYLA